MTDDNMPKLVMFTLTKKEYVAMLMALTFGREGVFNADDSMYPHLMNAQTNLLNGWFDANKEIV